MGEVDSIPVVSQAKSLVQVIGGDAEGARETQENFSRRCPVVSQARSLGEAIAGDTEAAAETQNEFGKDLGRLADGIPVVGHIKGGIHYAVGDTEGGDHAMKAASRTTGVIGGGVGGFFVGGPVGAVAGGVAGGAAMDGITTGIDSAVHKEYRPAGYVAMGENIKQKVDKGENVAGDIFDIGITPVFDGLAGYGAGKAVGEALNPGKGARPVEAVPNEPPAPIEPPAAPVEPPAAPLRPRAATEMAPRRPAGRPRAKTDPRPPASSRPLTALESKVTFDGHPILPKEWVTNETVFRGDHRLQPEVAFEHGIKKAHDLGMDVFDHTCKGGSDRGNFVSTTRVKEMGMAWGRLDGVEKGVVYEIRAKRGVDVNAVVKRLKDDLHETSNRFGGQNEITVFGDIEGGDIVRAYIRREKNGPIVTIENRNFNPNP